MKVKTAIGYAWQASRSIFTVQVLLAVAAGAAPVAVAWLTKAVLDTLTGATTSASLLPAVLALAAAGLAAVVLPHLLNHTDRELGRAVTIAAKRRLYTAISGLGGLARFEDPAFHNRLRMAGMGGSAPADLVGCGLGLGQGAVTVAGFLVTLALLNPWMALVVVIAAGPTLYAELMLARERTAMHLKLGNVSRREFFYTELLTSVTAAREVRLFGLGDFFGRRMLAEARVIDRENRRADRRELGTQALLAALGAVAAGGGLVWAVLAARSGRLTAGDVTIFVASVAGVQAALRNAIAAIGQGRRALLLFEQYEYVVHVAPDLEPAPSGHTRPVPPLRRGIELRDVWFRYADDLPWVLSGLDLTVAAGGATALVGLNGAGKSTLVNLLCRFYDPQRGAVLWDGIDIREFDVTELRDRIGAVFQDFMRYDLTVGENIAAGDVRHLDEPAPGTPRLIAAAAENAGVATAIEALPRGYDTMLSRIYTDGNADHAPATGVVFSGGQWQRLAVARALFREGRDLLILDEPSAGLDAEAEHALHRRLYAHRFGRTSLLISHRLGAVRDADTIAVLDGGRVAELGSHDQLMAAGGRYAELFSLQATGYQRAG
ncbi:ABC transporter ATP-binding protein [Actinoplanes sp. NPDC051861]|uniref:ABC transporter ATP-binding protein n=1 Tax=Actinoplanes sp. NPDC051861 TaxID=3155170 RepID=UPI0034404ADD